jgi:ABC-type Fe3+ transport system substrate-binding protein
MKIFSSLIGGLLAVLIAGQALAVDKLVIISPHRKSIQEEFVPQFEAYYKKAYKTEVKVEWIDQGGTSDDVRFVRAKYASNPKTSGIDIFWGGGTTTFLDLNTEKLLDSYELPADLAKQIPANAAGVPMYDKSKTWYASAMSSFGIFYNKKLLKFEHVEAPKTWEDLANPKFTNLISLTDPRRSGTATLMNTIVLQSQGWEKGWRMLHEIAGNTRMFTHSSSDPIKAVVSGDAVAAMAIDFYANAKIADLGPDNLGFALPPGQTVLDPDPIAIMKGAPNRKIAERFVSFVLSKDPQKLLVLPKGAKEGPKLSYLGRMAVNTVTYAETNGKRVDSFNPFDQKPFLQLDIDQAAKTKDVFNDLIGAIMIDTHTELKRAWQALHKNKQPDAALLKEFGKTPITEKEFLAYADRWSDEKFRNQQINAWVNFAKKKFEKIEKQAASH